MKLQSLAESQGPLRQIGESLICGLPLPGADGVEVIADSVAGGLKGLASGFSLDASCT